MEWDTAWSQSTCSWCPVRLPFEMSKAHAYFHRGSLSTCSVESKWLTYLESAHVVNLCAESQRGKNMDGREDNPEPHVILPKYLRERWVLPLLKGCSQRMHCHCSVSSVCSRSHYLSCMCVLLFFPSLHPLESYTREVRTNNGSLAHRDGEGQNKAGSSTRALGWGRCASNKWR